MSPRGPCILCGLPAATWVSPDGSPEPIWCHLHCDPGQRSQLVAVDSTTGTVAHLMDVWARVTTQLQQAREQRGDGERSAIRERLKAMRFGYEYEAPAARRATGVTVEQWDRAVQEGLVIRVGRGLWARVS